MFYLMQILRMIPTSEIDCFFEMFSDLEFEIEEMGWNREELIKDMLFNHYGFEILDDRQLATLSNSMKDEKVFKSAIQTTKFYQGNA